MKIVLSTTKNEQEAKDIAKTLVKKKLAACVNIIPAVTSIYEWENELQEDKEALMIIKTSQDKANAVKDEILKMHSYSLPEIIFLETSGGHSAYEEWVLRHVSSCK